MLTDHAGALLQAAGKSFGDKIPERGVFTADQLGPAIQGIERAIADYQKSGHDDDEDEDKQPVALDGARRGPERNAPFRYMMRQSRRRRSHLGSRAAGSNVAGRTICPAIFATLA